MAQVVVYVHGGADGLDASLSSVLGSFPATDVLVVDDSKDERVRDALARSAAAHGYTVVQNLDALGFWRSVAKAARMATARYLVVVDATVVLTAGSLRELVEELQAGRIADVAVGLLDVQLGHGPGEPAADTEPASFLANANPELAAAAVAGCSTAGSIGSVVPSFTGHPCFAARRADLAGFPGGDASPFPGSVRVSVVVGCWGSYRGAVIDPAYEPVLAALADHIVPQIVADLRAAGPHAWRIPRLLGKTALFVLPSAGGDGGANSVVQEVVGLRRCGLDARIANRLANRRAFERSYPGSEDFCSFYADEDELVTLAREAAIVVATNFASVTSVKRIVDRDPAVAALYYVQDYEPWFYAEDDPRHAAARASYTLVPGARAFAKTDWLCRTVSDLAGIEVARIEPSLERELHNGLEARAISGPVPIAAMVRPSSGRRNARGTLRVLGRIRERHGAAVDIRVFGCADDELDPLVEAQGFRFVNLGVLRQWEVADVLRGAGVFADLSTYQAFGATGLEAMAAGCATVLPRGSGVEQYARDEDNCLLVDTADEDEAVAAIERLLTDADLLERIRASALETGRQYSVRKCAWSLLLLFEESLRLAGGMPSDEDVAVAG